MKINSFSFGETAYVQTKVSNKTLKQFKDYAKFIFKNKNLYTKHNNGLAGNLQDEYKIDKTEYKEILKPYLNTLVNEFYGNEECPDLKLSEMWINFQKKYEHNPIHRHRGHLSFVFWIQIPYCLEEELSLPNCKNSNTPVNSLFTFVYTNYYGEICSRYINVDKTYEGTIVMFRSKLDHMVYPFYTSDEHRISISGNLDVYPTNTSKNEFTYT